MAQFTIDQAMRIALQRHQHERSIRVPDSFWCHDAAVMTAGMELGPRASPLPALATGRVTFGCLNNFCKVTTGCYPYGRGCY